MTEYPILRTLWNYSSPVNRWNEIKHPYRAKTVKVWAGILEKFRHLPWRYQHCHAYRNLNSQKTQQYFPRSFLNLWWLVCNEPLISTTKCSDSINCWAWKCYIFVNGSEFCQKLIDTNIRVHAWHLHAWFSIKHWLGPLRGEISLYSNVWGGGWGRPNWGFSQISLQEIFPNESLARKKDDGLTIGKS